MTTEQSRQRATAEIEQFTKAYPDRELDDIPVSVWEQVRGGKSLTDAYSEYESALAKAYESANAVNVENAYASSGGIGEKPKGAYYTASEVAAMTPSQVAENYDDILYSMKSAGFFAR